MPQDELWIGSHNDRLQYKKRGWLRNIGCQPYSARPTGYGDCMFCSIKTCSVQSTNKGNPQSCLPISQYVHTICCCCQSPVSTKCMRHDRTRCKRYICDNIKLFQRNFCVWLRYFRNIHITDTDAVLPATTHCILIAILEATFIREQLILSVVPAKNSYLCAVESARV